MTPPDPHIHVDVKLHADVAVREVTAATFGLVGDLPSRATTGCGQDVPYAMTSAEPRTVTCLPCREYARRRYLELADSVERFGLTDPGLGSSAATAYRKLAGGFG
jgi:hypothetical protein